MTSCWARMRPGADGRGVRVQQRVDAQLRQVGERLRACRGVPRRIGAAAPGRHVADPDAVLGRVSGDRGEPGHLVPALVLRAERVDVVGDAHRREGLHRAHVEQMRPGESGVEAAALQQQQVDPALREHDGGRQADGAAADDDHAGALGPRVRCDRLQQGLAVGGGDGRHVVLLISNGGDDPATLTTARRSTSHVRV